jgi:uncharacterized protein (DUF2062 family)
MLKRLKNIVITQLTQGAHPRGLALSCSVAFVFGVIPLMGTTTLLCLLIGPLFKVNQPLTQFLNYLLYPLQIFMIPVFLRMGEWILGAKQLVINPLEMVKQFAAGPGAFLSQYWIVGVHALLAWILVAPILGILVYFLARPVFEGVAARIRNP